MIPSAWVAAVLALAAFRITRLIGWDDLPPIARLRSRITGETVRRSATERDGLIYDYRRPVLAHFLRCAYCQGFWTGLAVYGAWLCSERLTLYALAPFALSAAIGITARVLDP